MAVMRKALPVLLLLCSSTARLQHRGALRDLESIDPEASEDEIDLDELLDTSGTQRGAADELDLDELSD